MCNSCVCNRHCKEQTKFEIQAITTLDEKLTSDMLCAYYSTFNVKTFATLKLCSEYSN